MMQIALPQYPTGRAADKLLRLLLTEESAKRLICELQKGQHEPKEASRKELVTELEKFLQELAEFSATYEQALDVMYGHLDRNA